jgi:hypothetical protein
VGRRPGQLQNAGVVWLRGLPPLWRYAIEDWLLRPPARPAQSSSSFTRDGSGGRTGMHRHAATSKAGTSCWPHTSGRQRAGPDCSVPGP